MADLDFVRQFHSESADQEVKAVSYLKMSNTTTDSSTGLKISVLITSSQEEGGIQPIMKLVLLDPTGQLLTSIPIEVSLPLPQNAFLT